MAPIFWILLCLVSLVLVGLAVVAWRKARRIDRLHRRVETKRAGLNRQLIKRGAETLRTADLMQMSVQDAVVLRSAATEALACADAGLVLSGLGTQVKGGPGVEARLRAESFLSATLRSTLSKDVRALLEANPVSAAQLAALDEACGRSQLIRTLHNQDVEQTLVLRDRRFVRVFHLAGAAALPQLVLLDDVVNADD